MEDQAGPSGISKDLEKPYVSDDESDDGKQLYATDIPDWLFDFDEKPDCLAEEVNELVSPEDIIIDQVKMESCLKMYETPKSRVPIVIENIMPDIETTPKKMRNTPLPLLSWADNEEIWQNIVYKEEVNLKLRSYKMFDDRSTYLPRMRAILLDWIMEVCEVYHLRRNTYYLAIDYIDRYLTVKPTVPKTQLQLLGVACLFIAAKLEEIYPPKLTEFSYVCDGACTESEILSCEILLLNTLFWEVNPMTPTGWLNLYMQIHNNADEFKKRMNVSTDNHFQYPQYSGYEFVRASHLIDLFSMDPGFLRFSYSIIAAAAIYYTYDKEIALAVSGLKWKQLKSCVSYMSVFNYIVQHSSDPRLASIVPAIEDDRLEGSFRFLKKNIPKVIADENHSIQTHLIDLDYFERSVVLRLKLYGLSIEKIYVKKKRNDNEEYETTTEEPAEKVACVIMYKLIPAKENLSKTDHQSPIHPTHPDYESGKINIFKIKQKTTVTFDDILSSIHNDSPFIKQTRALRDPKSCYE